MTRRFESETDARAMKQHSVLAPQYPAACAAIHAAAEVGGDLAAGELADRVIRQTLVWLRGLSDIERAVFLDEWGQPVEREKSREVQSRWRD